MTKTIKNTEVTYEEIFSKFQAGLIATECYVCDTYSEKDGESKHEFDDKCSCGEGKLAPWTDIEVEHCACCGSKFGVWDDYAMPAQDVVLDSGLLEVVSLDTQLFVCLDCSNKIVDKHNYKVSGGEA